MKRSASGGRASNWLAWRASSQWLRECGKRGGRAERSPLARQVTIRCGPKIHIHSFSRGVDSCLVIK